LALIVLLAASGATYEAIMRASDARRYPPPGQLVDVSGHRLHLHCVGQGSPTVVLDAGLGAFSLDWGAVQPRIATSTRVCAYDRAGLGWSEPGPLPRSPQQFANELHLLLTKAGVEGPYVLVVHSISGKTARLFASQHPNDVAGMVLIDARHESVDEHLTPEQIAAEGAQQRRFQNMSGGWRSLGWCGCCGRQRGRGCCRAARISLQRRGPPSESCRLDHSRSRTLWLRAKGAWKATLSCER
jgi:pimeloyl-ACP methyl ester carboxylesterase